MRFMPWLGLFFATMLITSNAAATRIATHASPALRGGAIAACPHLDQLLSAVRQHAGLLVVTRIRGGDVARLFADLPVDLPEQVARADSAVIVRRANARGEAIVVLFVRGCVLAALRLPVGAVTGAIKRAFGEEI